MKMIERMALAMLEADAWPIGKSEAGQALAQHLALAALKAMREPSEEMTGALITTMWPGEIIYDDSFTSEREMVHAGWEAAIDTAIKEAEAG